MSTAGNKEVQKAKVRTRLYFVLAGAMLFLMALTSSVSPAFIYIFSGLATIFGFLAWQNWRDVVRDKGFAQYDRSERGWSTSSFTETIRTKFRQKTATTTISTPLSGSVKRAIRIVASIAGGIFTLVMVITVLDSPEDNVHQESGEEAEADVLFSSGDYDGAYVEYRRAIATNESPGEGYYGIANIKYNQNDADSAMYYYGKALEAMPEMYDAAYGRALILFNQQNYSGTLQELKYILDRTDKHMNAYLLAGDSHYFSNQYDNAIGYYEIAYGIGARSKELANVMAYVYDVNGDPERAIPFYKETLEYDSTMTEIHRRLGELLPGQEGHEYRKKAGQQW